MRPEPSISVICLAGPTGSGKTALALELAEKFACEIINADSRQVYADFPIITAQPAPAQKHAFPHHLYGFLPATEKISAGEWQRLALAQCREITQRGRIPLFVGGTGFYFNALLNGFAEIPPVDPEIALVLEERRLNEGLDGLYSELRQIDPAYAGQIHPHDRQRILRSLEVYHGTGRPFSWWHQHRGAAPAAHGPLLVLAFSLEKLAPLLEQRITTMLEAGAIEEAWKALEHCSDAAAPGWSGIGCAELFAFLQGGIDFAECRRRWFANTRAYAKRQLTWFRGRKNAIWIEPDNPAGAFDVIARAAIRPVQS